MPTSRTIWFAGGGTGGHLYPGLAIARALVRETEQWRPLFIGAQRGVERDVLPSTEFPHQLLPLHPLYRSAVWKNWRTLTGGVAAFRALSAMSRHERPAAVVSTGGYAAAIALAWARCHGVPHLVHEPDAHAGLTTRLFARSASGVFVGFPEALVSLGLVASPTAHVLGAPIESPPTASERLAQRTRVRAALGIPDAAFVVLVFGGSQGARALNQVVAEWVGKGLPDGVALLWGTGRSQAHEYVALDRRAPSRVVVQGYLSPITDAYAASDLAVSRAGAMSIAELCAWGVPPILVPLPTAAQDHQRHNAEAVASSGAGQYVPQSQLSPSRLDDVVRKLLRAPHELERMKHLALARARPTAARDIARTIDQLLR